MPAIVTITTHDTKTVGVLVGQDRTHKIIRVASDHYVAYGHGLPDRGLLMDTVPAGEWVTNWASCGSGALMVHIMLNSAEFATETAA